MPRPRGSNPRGAHTPSSCNLSLIDDPTRLLSRRKVNDGRFPRSHRNAQSLIPHPSWFYLTTRRLRNLSSDVPLSLMQMKDLLVGATFAKPAN